MKTKKLNGNFNIIGSNLKKYREAQGLSQRQLADQLTLLGVNIFNSDISRMENNALFVRDYELFAFCKVLKIKPEQLYENADNYFQ